MKTRKDDKARKNKSAHLNGKIATKNRADTQFKVCMQTLRKRVSTHYL